ncbi:MAG: hypothetical protein FD156_1777 [Nitrospirae bacterium]|nr:MAG: hypothetical protein FD156_1777 [Nitrospirota bacterium]
MTAPATGSFGAMNDFATNIKSITPEYYQQVAAIIDRHLNDFVEKSGRMPNVIDIGGAGVLPFDLTIPNKICILDIFQKPDCLTLPDNAEWIVHNILSEDMPNKEKYDIVIMSGVLHHLADKNNNIRQNLAMCLENVKKLLATGGCCLIFESICPPYFDKLQDLFYPIYSRILTKALKFPYARLLTLKEIATALNAINFNYRMVDFRQIKQHYFAGYKVSSKIYPISYICVELRA